jgi:hypothetical protein
LRKVAQKVKADDKFTKNAVGIFLSHNSSRSLAVLSADKLQAQKADSLRTFIA